MNAFIERSKDLKEINLLCLNTFLSVFFKINMKEKDACHKYRMIFCNESCQPEVLACLVS